MSVRIYTGRFCAYCVRAKRLLDDLKIPYQEISVDTDEQALATMYRESGRRTIPQIWFGSIHVGGCDELMQLHFSGQLMDLLQKSQTD